MKRVLTCVGGLLLSCAFVSAAYAGAIDNKTNWSAEYIRTLNRNAATDYADIAAYNPAGTVKLQDGFILNGSLQYLGKLPQDDIPLLVTIGVVHPFEVIDIAHDQGTGTLSKILRTTSSCDLPSASAS